MSKAFTREDDLGGEEPLPPLVSALPEGSPNLMTPGGRARLQQEAGELAARRSELLPRARTTPPDADARAELRKLEQRLRYVEQSLRTAEVVSPPAGTIDAVQFGAVVSVRDKSGATAVYRLVGVDETEADANGVSWFSPIGRALLNARVGDRVSLKTPRGVTELQVVGVRYPES